MATLRRALQKSRSGVNFFRGMRFRLAFGFIVIFTLMLLGMGVLFRQMLVNILSAQDEALLKEEWAASKGYLRIEHQRAVWYYDPYDPEEALIVNRMTGRVYLFADENGNILDRSNLATELGLDSEKELTARLKRLHRSLDAVDEVVHLNGNPYLIRSGMLPDKDRRLYLLVLGHSVAATRDTVNLFTWRYLIEVPAIILLCGALGWLLAGKALTPVNDVARAAQKITGSNLNMQIPTRGAGDELDHLTQTFNRMIERLNQSFEQIRQFSTDVSHELRTPLTAIRGQLEVALFTAKTPDQYRDAMVNALQDVEQLSNIVRALLLLSQAESGQVALQLTPVDLSSMVRDMVEQFQIPAEDGGVRLEGDAVEPVWVHADRTQIGRLISNLLSNGIKYTPKGGWLRASVRAEDGAARLEVEDNGIGIPAEKLPHIFDRFYRVRRSESNPIQGLGLGLSFVSWIVQAHDGKIDVSSTEGKGTCFSVTLPLYEAPAKGEVVEQAGVSVG